jgi:uncharacterized protein YndB with AHSA1/START domain
MDIGTYVELAGRPAVRFSRTYPHPIERVWAAVTEPDQLRHWFPSAVKLDLKVDGTIAFSGDPNVDDTTGTILACEPPRLLVFSWGGNELHFELEAVGTGACRFTLIDVLSERVAAARNAAGWAVCLGELEKRLGGEQADGPHSATALAWRPLYEAAVAAGLPSGAPIPTAG